MKIAAFNVKNLGMRKVSDDVVRTNLIKIMSQYSVVVLLEVVDSSGQAMEWFCEQLNDYEDNQHDPFTMVSSKPLGRSTHRERFVFFYRESDVRVMDTYQYEEESEDKLAREPFIVQFKCLYTALTKLVLIPVHSKPKDAEIELNALFDVVQAVKERYRTTNIMILGDFNADGPYLSQSRKEKSPMLNHPYYWLIDDDIDTTTSNSNDHTYDRIVVFGKHMRDSIVPHSAKAFNFQKAYRLSDATTQAISDHYPVEVQLKEREG